MLPAPSTIFAAAAQGDRLRRFDARLSVDVHCHCLPGLDDGPRDLKEALALARALVDDGITDAIATPHQLGRYEGRNTAEEVRGRVAEFNEALAASDIPLHVVAGADVRVDERLPALLEADEILTLGDNGAYLLLELPHDVYIEPSRIVEGLAGRGVATILSHPERHPRVARQPDLVLPWLDQGASLQVTAASLCGGFGADAERAAWELVERGLVDLVATDAHGALRRRPALGGAVDAIAAEFGHAVARRICIENPARVLCGEPLLVHGERPADGRVS